MSFSFSNLLASVRGSTVSEFAVLRKRKKQSVVALQHYAMGEPVRISGCVYGLNPLNPGSWAGGELEIEPGAVTWHMGGFRQNHGQRITADAFSAAGLRQIKIRESWAVGPGCISLSGEWQKHRLEIAVLEDDIVLVLDGLKASRLLD